MIVIISCGAKKRTTPCAARDLYIGNYFRTALRYALALTAGDEGKVFILSAKWGLLTLDQIVEPYELRMGRPGAIAVEHVRAQADLHGIASANIVAVAGDAYVKLCRQVWGVEIQTPLTGKGGLFQQLAWMREQTRLLND